MSRLKNTSVQLQSQPQSQPKLITKRLRPKVNFVSNIFPSHVKPNNVQPQPNIIVEKNSKRRALLIGINYIGSSQALKGCVDDVYSMKKILTKLNYNEIIIVTDEVTNLKKPTKKEITNQIKDIVSRSKSGDILFVHYSGHGTYTVDKNNDERDNQDEEIYTVDNKVITDDELNDLLVKSLPDGVILRAVFDSCFSGSVLDLPVRYDDKVYPENDMVLSKKNILMISGCKDSQTSADAFIDGQFNGALTWAFITAFDGLNLYRETKWTWKDFVNRIRYLLVKNNFDQRPQLSSNDESLLSTNLFF